MQIGPQIHDQIIDEPVDAQAGQPEEADGERHNTERPQEVLRPLIKAGEEIDGEQVEEALDDPRGPVLAQAEIAGAVVNDDFPHLPAEAGGQDREETGHIDVEADFTRYFAAVSL